MFLKRFGTFWKETQTRKIVVAVLSAALLIGNPVWAQPYSVTNVVAGDVLNIRKGIDYTQEVGDSEVVGTIPHDAADVWVTGITVDVKGAPWREVEYNGAKGWVNSRYIKPTSLYLETPDALSCVGMEPFWGVEIDENGSSYSSPETEQPVKLDYLRLESGIGRTDLWAHYLGTADQKHALTVIVRYTETCYDTMSDYTYDFEAILLGLGGSGAPAHGCCKLKR